ncbi:MAG: ribBA2 [Frankiales bacterium]|nr:ribBA2 [Frankiales bacterium]
MSVVAATRSVRQAVAALAAGRMVLVLDAPDREAEGDLLMAAELVTEQDMAFLVHHTSGIICAPMTVERAAELRLPQMVADNTDAHGTAFTVSVDHLSTGTGVSAADRTATIRALSDPRTVPGHLRRPGHVFPLQARPGGVLVRAGHTEAAVDLTTMAGLSGVGVIGEVTDADGSMRRGAALADFAAEHSVPVLTIADLIRYRRCTERLVEPVATSLMPTAFGEFRAVAYRNTVDGTEHLAMLMGDVAAAGQSAAGVLVRVHSECLTGDILGSLRCDCGSQLEQALLAIADEGCGAVLYLRGHEGRGIGLAHKIRAYALQEEGMDTVDANTAQGLPVDSRSYGVGSQVLADLGANRIRLMTNNPAKYSGLEGHGLTIVDRVALPVVETPHNVRYLRTKRDRMGHDLQLPAVGG